MKSEVKYARFGTEEELLRSISLPFDSYPRVSAIGGKKIRPDIDILEIRMLSKNQYKLIGYELKLMKFDRRSGGLSWDSFYKGIGQALLYLKSGIQQAVLVLGFHKSVLNDEIIDGFRNWLWDNREFLSQAFTYLSLDVRLYERSSIAPIIEARSDFYSSNSEIRLLSDELLQRKFTFDKKLKGK